MRFFCFSFALLILTHPVFAKKKSWEKVSHRHPDHRHHEDRDRRRKAKVPNRNQKNGQFTRVELFFSILQHNILYSLFILYNNYLQKSFPYRRCVTPTIFLFSNACWLCLKIILVLATWNKKKSYTYFCHYVDWLGKNSFSHINYLFLRNLKTNLMPPHTAKKQIDSYPLKNEPLLYQWS